MPTPENRIRRTAVAALAGAGLVVGSAFALSAVAGASSDDPVVPEPIPAGEAVELTADELAELDEAFAAYDQCLADNGVEVSEWMAEPLPADAEVFEVHGVAGAGGAVTLPEGAVVAEPLPEGAEFVEVEVVEGELVEGQVVAGTLVEGAWTLDELPEPFASCSAELPEFEGAIGVATTAPAPAAPAE